MLVRSPQHPLIALINGVDRPVVGLPPQHHHVLNFYKISFRPNLGGTLRYGQTYFDFSEGGMFFAAPNQVVGNNDQVGGRVVENQCVNQQITLLMHPDFLLNYPLAKTIKRYGYFSYSINEALHLSDKEKDVILSFRPNLGGTLLYVQTYFDFSEGGMFFAAPNQGVGNNDHVGGRVVENQCVNQQITLLMHPDFLLNYPLAKTIKRYGYFSYSINEALHLSDKEKDVILSVFRNMEDELSNRIDEVSHDVIHSQIELLLKDRKSVG